MESSLDDSRSTSRRGANVKHLLVAVFAASMFGCSSKVHRRDLAMEEPPDLADPSDLRVIHDRDAACGEVFPMVVGTRRPVDIIVLLDNSTAMSDVARAVEQNINVHFADVLEKGGIDYRIILLSHYGSSHIQRVCVPPPLSQQSMNCSPLDPKPLSNPPRFFHFNWRITSHDSFRQAISRYYHPDLDGNPPPTDNCGGACAGWSRYVRKGAIKVFVAVTNDMSDMPATTIDASLATLDSGQFGSLRRRNYVVHSIVGLDANNPPTKPWLPYQPVQKGTCGDSITNGHEYQVLSILTGGVRLPVCETANFDAVFEQVAAAVIEGDKPLSPCEYELPEPPLGNMHIGSAIVEYTPPGGTPQEFTEAFGLNECDSASFYVQGNLIVLCPDTCAWVRHDPMPALRFLLFCAPAP